MPSGVYERRPYDGKSLLERIFRRRIIDPVTGCWLWPRSVRNTSGYGQIFFDHHGKKYVATVHRIVAWLYLGYDGNPKLEVCHRCNVKACFNPAHLYIATNLQNKQDALRDGLIVGHKKGVEHYEARFTEEQIRDIRQRVSTGETYNSVAVQFRVHRSTIRRIATRKTWKHLTDEVMH